MNDLVYLSATSLAQKIRQRDVSPVEVVDCLINRIEKLNPTLNAYCTLALEDAKKAAIAAENSVMQGKDIGCLHGIPVAIKDNIHVANLRYTAGAKMLSDRIAKVDHIAVKRLRDEGAIILGMTNMPEFGHKGTTDNDLFGITRNPWNPDCTPGGSSGGSASAVAAGMAYLALGGDFGGSIRIPAAFCGIVGHRPSLGRVPNIQPGADIFSTADVIGPLARSVQDTALMLTVISGEDERDPFSIGKLEALDKTEALQGMRIGWSASPTGGPVDADIAHAAKTSLETLVDLGITVEALDVELAPPNEVLFAFAAASYAHEFHNNYETIRNRLTRTHIYFLENLLQFSKLSLVDYMDAREQAMQFIEKVGQLFSRYDFIATPTTAVPAFSVDLDFGPDHINGEPIVPFNGWFFTWPFNITGHPAVSLPCGWDKNGTAYGLQLVGKRRKDALVLRLASEIESRTPHSMRHPDL